jgi:hypothetical protein
MASNSYGKRVGLSTDVLDFTEAAEKTIHSVVHVKMFPRRYKIGSISGTGNRFWCNHLRRRLYCKPRYKDASEIEITLNNKKKSYKAKLIGPILKWICFIKN